MYPYGFVLFTLLGGSSSSTMPVAARNGGCEDDLDLLIKTTSGTIKGFINETAPDVRQWLGIPYAEPPVKNLRFLPPKPKVDDGAIIETTAFQPSCIQQTSNAKTVYTEYMPQFLINGNWSEDCLYINIYAPKNPVGEKLPVFIYIPGGGFTGGGANSVYKIPDKWIQRTQAHIVILMNYRLNIFGYPNAKAAPLNAGLLDQRLVVEWARDNIEAFGGDPAKMVLWGQSAGSTSVGLYGYAYVENPIVKGLISDSGAASILGSTDGAHQHFSTFAKAVGCGNLSSEVELDCMQKVDASTIQSTLSSGSTGLSFTPATDNTTRFANNTERISAGKIANLPMIMGNNANEGAGFGTFNESGLTEAQYKTGLQAIVCPVSTEVKNRVQYGLATYRYYYAGNFSNISPRPWIGATHSAELPLLFGTHYEFRGNSTEFEWEVSFAMEGLWLAFANNPQKNPAYGHLFWPKYTPCGSSMLLLANDTTVAQRVPGSVVDVLCG